MTKAIALEAKTSVAANSLRGLHSTHEQPSTEDHRRNTDLVDAKDGLAEGERELLSEVLRAVRSINYGSVVLTIHEGRLVEISKTIRLRKNLPPRKE